MNAVLIYSLVYLVVGIALGYILRAVKRDHSRDQRDAVDSTVFGEAHYPPERWPVSYPSFTIAHKRHPQFILAMEAAFFDQASHFMKDLNLLDAADFFAWPHTLSALVLKERQALEPDGNYRQLLPYTMVRRRDADGEMRYLAYERTQRVGEQRLAGKVSIGFGGHVDAAGVRYQRGASPAESIIDLGATLMECAQRERDEELRIHTRCEASVYDLLKLPIQWGGLFITQQSTPERMHLGIVMFIDLPDHIELECAEPELLTLGMKTAEELMSAHIHGDIELEAWSLLLIGAAIEDSHLDRMLGEPAPSHEPL